MKILMTLDEWNSKFKQLQEGDWEWVYRPFNGFFREIVHVGAFPCCIDVEVEGRTMTYQIYDIVALEATKLPEERRIKEGLEGIIHGIQLRKISAKKAEEIGYFKWEKECDWWFESLPTQSQVDIVGISSLSTPYELWLQAPLEKRQAQWKASLKEMKDIEEEMSSMAKAPFYALDDESAREKELKSITKDLLGDIVEDQVPVPSSPSPPPPPPDDKDIGFTGAMLSCGDCGKLVSPEATSCPHCGATFEDEVPVFIDDEEELKDIEEPEKDPWEGMTFAELKKYAVSRGIKTNKKKKAKIIAELKKL